MLYDYTIVRSRYTGLREVEDSNTALVALFHSDQAEAAGWRWRTMTTRVKRGRFILTIWRVA